MTYRSDTLEERGIIPKPEEDFTGRSGASDASLALTKSTKRKRETSSAEAPKGKPTISAEEPPSEEINQILQRNKWLEVTPINSNCNSSSVPSGKTEEGSC
jgi:hypothetical protein